MNSICVYCGSSDGVSSIYLTSARRMGAILAQRHITLVFEGGRTGLMGAVADRALENGAQVMRQLARP